MRGGALDQTLERSDALTRAGRHDEHLELMREAVRRFPDQDEVLIRAAAAHVMEAPEEAARLAVRAVTLAPGDPAMLTRAASVAFALERYEQATAWVKDATARADGDFPLAFDLIHLGGKLAIVRGDDEHAEQLLRAAFEQEPETPGHAEVLAGLLEERGRPREALAVIDEADSRRSSSARLDTLRTRLRIAVEEPDNLPPGDTIDDGNGDTPR